MRLRRLRALIVGGAFAVVTSAPLAAMAQEGGEAAAEGKSWQEVVGRAAGAGFAMGISALSAGYAQAKIGSAGAGTLAERPEASTSIIVLQVLPEIIALLGFAIAFVIFTM